MHGAHALLITSLTAHPHALTGKSSSHSLCQVCHMTIMLLWPFSVFSWKPKGFLRPTDMTAWDEETRRPFWYMWGWLLDVQLLLVQRRVSTETDVTRHWRLNIRRKTTRLLRVMTLLFSLSTSYMLKHIQFMLPVTSLKLMAVTTIFRAE